MKKSASFNKQHNYTCIKRLGPCSDVAMVSLIQCENFKIHFTICNMTANIFSLII